MTIYKRVPDLRAPEASVAMSQNYKRLLLLYSATNLTGDLRQERLFSDGDGMALLCLYLSGKIYPIVEEKTT